MMITDLAAETEKRLAKIEKREKADRLKRVHLQHQTVLKKKEISLRDLYSITDNLF